jgi:hypothetical protein
LAPNRATGDAITLHHENASLHVTVFRYTSRDDVFPSRPRVLLTIADPNASPQSREHALASLFNLTAAENRVTGLLLAGLEPKQIAARTKTTENTGLSTSGGTEVSDQRLPFERCRVT